jgi:hypothetical protein
MDPINTVIKLLMATITLAQTIGTGSLGDSYVLLLHSWRNEQTDIRGEFYYRQAKRYDAPKFTIIPAAQGSFLAVEEHGIVDEDGSVEIVASRVSRQPFPITQASRENWRCEVPGPNGPLARISKIADFKLMLVGTMPLPSRMLEILGGHSRLYLRFPGSGFALSPCTGLPDRTGQNVMGTIPGDIPRTEVVHVRPAVMKGTTVIPMSARVILQPQRVNWVYWDSERGFGPTLTFDGYCADPSRPTPAPEM